MDNAELIELFDDLIETLSHFRDDDDNADELYWRCAAASRELKRDQRYVQRAV